MDVFIPLSIIVPLGIFIILFATRGLEPGERSWLITLLIVAFLLRVAAATMFAAFPPLRVFHEDAEGNEYNALYLASVWRNEAPPIPVPASNFGYVQLAAAVYYVLGRYPVNASLFNALLGTMLGFLIYNLAKKIFHEIVARRAALLVCLMPSMIMWGSIALKDVPVTFCIVLSLSSCVDLKNKLSLEALAGTLLPIAAIQPMRFYIVYFVAFAIIGSLALDRSLSYFTGIYRQVFILIAFAGLFILLGITDRAEADSQLLSLEYLSQYRHGMAVTANSGFDADVDISQPGSALAYLPIGISYLLLAPFPWQMTSLRPLIAAPETIFWWTLFPATIRGIVFSARTRFSETSPLLVFTTTLTAVYSLMHGNVGSAFRQRAQILVFLFIFTALGTSVSKVRRAGIEPMKLLRTRAQA
jgi:4-amino-4-deoxy-L-arabinose transferase-like glycosyltransferase